MRSQAIQTVLHHVLFGNNTYRDIPYCGKQRPRWMEGPVTSHRENLELLASASEKQSSIASGKYI